MKDKTREIQSRVAAVRRTFWWRSVVCVITCLAAGVFIVAGSGIPAVLLSIAAVCSIISVIYHQRRWSRLKQEMAA
jgi:hypothetical protein